jgi:ADP-heptose:LPS heptosyltransferase
MIAQLIARFPQHRWINLQIDMTDQEQTILGKTHLESYPGTITDMADTAGLIDNVDLIISVDSAISHLAAAMGKPTWIMLNKYAVDWRWLLDRDDNPWYPSARLFRQPEIDQWQPVIDKVARFVDIYKL